MTKPPFVRHDELLGLLGRVRPISIDHSDVTRAAHIRVSVD